MKHIYTYIILFSTVVTWLLPLDTNASGATTKDTILLSNDNIIQRKDTLHIGDLPKEYAGLKKQSSKNRWSKRIFSLLFREARTPRNDDGEKSMNEEFKPYEGKIIRNIRTIVIDPFGTDIEDPESEDEDVRFFNDLHIKTRSSTIKNILQFKEGGKVRPAIFTASEAQLRNMTYINDARIIIDSLSTTADSVDVTIIVRDKWTIGVELNNLTESKINLEIFDKNILGSGSRLGLNFIYSSKYDRKFGFGGYYLYENIAKTDIDLSGSYLDKIKSHELSVSAVRELQPKLDYFGEASYYKHLMRPERINWDSITPDHHEKFSLTLGKAFTLAEDEAIRRFVISLRYKANFPEYHEKTYQEHIKGVLRPYKYTKHNMLLMQLSLYQNAYQRQYMVYNFGTTENVAQGYNVSMQVGYSNFDKADDALYSSFKISYGSYELLKGKGNVFASASVSSFFNKKHPFGGVLTFDGQYYTPLLRLSSLRYRQFLTISYSKLLHPDRYLGDRIYMGEHTTLRIRDWRHGQSGSEQLLMKTETDIFSNYEVAGFRFLFYGFIDVGWIGQGSKLLSNDNLNYGLGAGIRLRNNFIVFNTIDLKIGFYPRLNQTGFNSFFKITSSTPDIPPDFIPGIPEEIVLE